MEVASQTSVRVGGSSLMRWSGIWSTSLTSMLTISDSTWMSQNQPNTVAFQIWDELAIWKKSSIFSCLFTLLSEISTTCTGGRRSSSPRTRFEGKRQLCSQQGHQKQYWTKKQSTEDVASGYHYQPCYWSCSEQGHLLQKCQKQSVGNKKRLE